MPDIFGKLSKSVILNIVREREMMNMLKIRLQGTKKDINWFKKLVAGNEEIKILQFSEPYTNKGTINYFRVYGEVEKNER